MTGDEERLAREQTFHDARFAGDAPDRPADRFYVISRASGRFVQRRISEQPAGSLMLDYGCGEGAFAAIEAAQRGLRVIAVDLSPVAISRARDRAATFGVAESIDFRVMNAEALELPAATFDFVCGLGVIHHLDIEAALREVARVMKPTAAALFSEPMGHNPLINLYRRRTPDQRTVDEHPIVMRDLPLFRARFGRVETTYFHLAGLLAIGLARTASFDRVLGALDRIDVELLRTPARRYAWMMCIGLADPRPAVASAG